MIEIDQEPFQLAGRDLAKRIKEADCQLVTDLFNWQDACVEFAYAYQVNWDLITATPLVVVSPFLETFADDQEDDCSSAWDYGLLIRVHAKVGKPERQDKPTAFVNRQYTQTYMSLMFWMKWLLDSDGFREIADGEFSRVDVEKATIIDQDNVIAGKFMAELIFNINHCLDREGPCSV